MYDVPEEEMYSPMFDESLHLNHLDPKTVDKTVCGYCGTCFASRNQLFYHLNFMNIDTRKIRRQDAYEHEEDCNLGDYGFSISHKITKKIRRVNMKKRKETVGLIASQLDKLSI